MALGKAKRKNAAASKSASKESVTNGAPPTKKARVSEAALLEIRPRNSSPGSVLTVGEGDTGQLGLGPDTMDCKRVKLVSGLENVIDVYAGGMHTLCLDKDGKVYSFGCNDESALGRSTAEEDSEMSPGLVPGLDAAVVQIAAGDSFSAALTEAGDVFVWGTYRDSSGAIGLVDPCQQEPTPRRLPLETPVAQIAAGSNHLALLDTAGHLFTAGNGEQGQLARVPELFSHRGGRRGLEMLLQPQRVPVGGRGARRSRFDRVWAGAFCTVVRDSATGALLGAGLNNYSQLGLDSGMAWSLEPMPRFADLSVAEFSGAMHHSVLRDEQGRVYTLGRKEDGRLGFPGLTEDVKRPTAVPKVADVKFRSVSAAGYVSLAVTEDGDLYSWGMGSTGQLGVGDDEDREEPDQAKGKQLEGREVLLVSAGGTHTVLLARNRQQNGH